MELFVLVNPRTGQLWNITRGWVDQHDMDTFTQEDRHCSRWRFPQEGQWKQLVGWDGTR